MVQTGVPYHSYSVKVPFHFQFPVFVFSWGQFLLLTITFRSMQSDCRKSNRLNKFPTIDEEEPHDIRRDCLSVASRRPLTGIVNTRREQLLALETFFYREDKEDNKNKDKDKVKSETKSSAEEAICVSTIQTLWPQTVIGRNDAQSPSVNPSSSSSWPQTVIGSHAKPLPLPMPTTREEPSLDEDAVDQRQKKGMIARGLDKIRKSISLPNLGSGTASIWHESRAIATTAHKQKGSHQSIHIYHLNPLREPWFK